MEPLQQQGDIKGFFSELSLLKQILQMLFESIIAVCPKFFCFKNQ